MRVPEPLRYSPFRMYRRKSFYTGLYGTNYSGPTRPPGDTTESAGVPIQSRPNPSHKINMSGFFDEYAPHPGPMQMSSGHYQPYDSSAIPHISRPNQPTVMDEFQMAALELMKANDFEPDVKYEDCLMDEDFFEMQMKIINEQFEGPPTIPWDSNEVASQFMEARSGEEISEFDRNLSENIFEIQMAVEQVKADTNPDSHDFGLTIPQDFFEQQEQMVESQYGQLQPELFDYGANLEEILNDQEALFDAFLSEPSPLEQAILDQPIEDVNPVVEPVFQSLEQIIETEPMQEDGMMPDDMAEMPDYDDSLMTPDLFEQVMDEVTEPMEPYPDPFGHYGGMMPQEMYDEQMQYMMDPLMIPEMMDPYMMPGPFGPGPMLDPGPGGAP